MRKMPWLGFPWQTEAGGGIGGSIGLEPKQEWIVLTISNARIVFANTRDLRNQRMGNTFNSTVHDIR